MIVRIGKNLCSTNVVHISIKYPCKPLSHRNETDKTWFLSGLHQPGQFGDVELLIDDADHPSLLPVEAGYRFRVIRHGNRNEIERVCWEIERRTSCFASSFSNIVIEIAQNWLESIAFYHNSRQS